MVAANLTEGSVGVMAAPNPNMGDFINGHFADSISVKQAIQQDKGLMAQIATVCDWCLDTIKSGGKILIAGNGGSAADAQHIAAEFIARFYFDRPSIASIALTTDTSILTAVSNDYAYDYIFARQIEGLGAKGDLFWGLSTSGNSANILRALEVSKTKGLRTIGFTGEGGGQMPYLCDLTLKVPSSDTPRIQESHILIAHIVCAAVEQFLYGDEKK